MTLQRWTCIFPQPELANTAPGYGLGLLLIFLVSSVIVATSALLVLGPTTRFYSGQASLNESSAKQLVKDALDTAQTDILAQQRLGTTITTSYRYPSSGTNTISVPTYPGSGSTVPKGTYYVTATYAQGFSFLLKANVMVGASNVTVSRLVHLWGVPVAGDVRFIGRQTSSRTGLIVSSASDVNNDGYKDTIIGASAADGGGTDSGEAYLILGRSTAAWATLTDVNGDFNLDNLSDANQTVRFMGRNAGDNAGYSTSSAGDVNNDGYVGLTQMFNIT